MNKINVNNIQRVCFHDGPGIRTTIFLNSCSLNCPWCANPETSIYKKKYFVNNSCNYIGSCPYKINCNGKNSSDKMLDKNFNICPVDAIQVNQKYYSIDELKKIILKDKFLYDSDGGVTFSGGEPLLQSNVLVDLFKELKKLYINITIETCLFVSKESLERVIDFIDLFIVDIKILNEYECKNKLNGNLKVYLDNIDYLFKNKKKVIFRIPLIKPFIKSEDNLTKIYLFLKKYKPLKVEIFRGHNLAKEKYIRLGLGYNKVETITDKEIEEIKNNIREINIDVEVISF